MLIKTARKKAQDLDSPLFHSDHSRPRTRREFISQGFMAGGAAVVGTSALSLFANPNKAYGALSSDLEALKASCGIATQGAGKIPFICFDLAGGANIAGSNVLVGRQGGQQDFLSTAGYSKLGLPADMIPGAPNMNTASGTHVNEDLGIAFHSDSAFLRGIQEKASAGTQANINGAVIPARSENDTGNNPHNPMYGIYKAGADGSLLSLIGSRNSDSGGNSMAPMDLMDSSVRPTKVDRPSDVSGLVDVGDLVGLLDQSDAVAVMESIQRISDQKMNQVNAYSDITANDVVKDLVRCGYVKSADIADRFGNPSTLDPAADTDIVGPGGIFSTAEFNSDSEFRKTASVMKLVVNGFAGAGTVTMGGFDYHTGERGTGERRDLRAGRCMGACLEYAARIGVPLMIYVCSD
ncbi:general secretion pathway protein GspF, partial [Oleiphilus sp. HI0118]